MGRPSQRGHIATRGARRAALAAHAFGARGAAELRAVTTREVRRGLKAAGRGDINDGHRGLQQELTGPSEPHLQVVALWDAVEMALEEPLDLPARKPRGSGDLIERERPLDVVLHELRHLDEAFVVHTELR